MKHTNFQIFSITLLASREAYTARRDGTVVVEEDDNEMTQRTNMWMRMMRRITVRSWKMMRLV